MIDPSDLCVGCSFSTSGAPSIPPSGHFPALRNSLSPSPSFIIQLKKKLDIILATQSPDSPVLFWLKEKTIFESVSKMSSEGNYSSSYSNLNKICIGFLSIVVPLSSGLAGCLTYQFINYFSTKMFLQNQNAQNLSEKQRHSSIYHSTQRSEEASKPGAYKIDHHTEAEVVVAPLENHVKNEQFDLKSPPHLPHDSSAFKSSYHPHFFDFRVDKKFHLTNLNKRNRFIRPWDFHQDQFGCLRDRFNVIVFFILVANLYSMALEIFVFKSLAHHTLVDTGFTRVYSWPLSNLIVVNYLINTGIRIYFARLASTMLRAPKMFLIISLFLLIMSLVGLVFQSVLVGAHLIDYDQIRHIFSGDAGEEQTIRDFVNDLNIYFRLIGIKRMRLDFLQLAWFGSLEGRISLAVLIMFETMFLATLASFVVLCTCLVLGGKIGIDFERINTVYAGFDGLVTKLHTISIFCSLQHKVNDRLKVGNKLIVTSRNMRDSALSGYGMDHSVAFGEPSSCKRRESRKGPQAIQFPDFDENEDEVSDELGGASAGDIINGADQSHDVEDNQQPVDLYEEADCSSVINTSENLRPASLDKSAIQVPQQAKIVDDECVGDSSLAGEGVVSTKGVANEPNGLVVTSNSPSFIGNTQDQLLVDARRYHSSPYHSTPSHELHSVFSSPSSR
ncbi:hypothetical protein PCANC_11626 [Puccinia coronata f. sp. avenae]|uniref:Uncharacterized protein n=1 Tax=Puccinia coronata f. sp. avenae TaxID=200324 RepID=A0A2N5SVJ0_9BASI|nr:hypothetical protein PCANC_11626 [Puccinia coronata f. sp. avenae]